ncbi:hypothetical protein [Nocardioides sp.]|uniref:hypothetical protein n=1 Tax=Nocardioides sp. TaxID=35761 RepID=UPI003784F3CE
MMRQTPRTFVGPVVLRLEEAVPPAVAARVRLAVAAVPGVASCELDADAATLVVSAARPVDRADLLDLLERVGCRVRS